MHRVQHHRMRNTFHPHQPLHPQHPLALQGQQRIEPQPHPIPRHRRVPAQHGGRDRLAMAEIQMPVPARWCRVQPGRPLAQAEHGGRVHRARDRMAQRRQRIDRGDGRLGRRDFIRRRQVRLGQQHQVRRRHLGPGLPLPRQGARRVQRIDGRDDPVQPAGEAVLRSRQQRVRHRGRIGQPRRFDRDASERRQGAGRAPLPQQIERVGDIAAHRAADAAIGQQHRILDRRFHQQMIQADGAELVHDHRRVGQIGMAQQPVQKRGLAAAEEPGDDRHRQRIRPAIFTHAVLLSPVRRAKILREDAPWRKKTARASACSPTIPWATRAISARAMSLQLARDGRRILWLAHECAPKNFTAVDVTDPRKPRVILQTDLPHRNVRSNSLESLRRPDGGRVSDRHARGGAGGDRAVRHLHPGNAAPGRLSSIAPARRRAGCTSCGSSTARRSISPAARPISSRATSWTTNATARSTCRDPARPRELGRWWYPGHAGGRRRAAAAAASEIRHRLSRAQHQCLSGTSRSRLCRLYRWRRGDPGHLRHRRAEAGGRTGIRIRHSRASPIPRCRCSTAIC